MQHDDNGNDKKKEPSKPKQKHVPVIGGEGSILPRTIESVLSWLLCLTCLLVSGYYYCIYRYQIYHQKKRSKTNQSEKRDNNKDKYLLPLTTCSKHEIHGTSCMERLNQLECYLNQKFGYSKIESSEKDLINYIRSDIICRRLATLAMCFEKNVMKYDSKNDFASILADIWSSLLRFPMNPGKDSIKISVVIAAYRENGKKMLNNLDQMYMASHEPKNIEIILVDAGQNTDFDNISISVRNNPWGNVNFQIAKLSGRGQCFNFGASFARGCIITFCHADMIVPRQWDTSILNAFRNNSIPSSTRIANCCTFSFGIANGNKSVPGLQAVQFSANLRCKLYHLPYGDQILSIPNSVFHYIGGFPNQALMEDYVLIDLLRKRCFYLQDDIKQREIICTLSDVAYCSSRRWEKLGVLYVTFMNSKIVHWYVSNKKSIDELYEIYYGNGSNVATIDSPWEVDLDIIINSR